jgi:hypothetical protein
MFSILFSLFLEDKIDFKVVDEKLKIREKKIKRRSGNIKFLRSIECFVEPGKFDKIESFWKLEKHKKFSEIGTLQ